MPTQIPKSLPSSAMLPKTDDYIIERHEALTRLMTVWSSLADKYSKPLKEDDVVDLLTGELVEDRGVISSWDRSKQGSFKSSRSRRVGCDILKHAKKGECMEAKEQRKELDGDDDCSDSDLEPLQHQFQYSDDELSFPPPPSSSPLPPSSPSVRLSSPCLPPIWSAFDSDDSEDELLGVWAQPEEKEPKESPKQSPTIQDMSFKIPSPKRKRTPKRKRVASRQWRKQKEQGKAEWEQGEQGAG